MKTGPIPRHINRRTTQRPISVWVEVEDYKVLRSNGVNVSEYVRKSISEAAVELKGKKK